MFLADRFLVNLTEHFSSRPMSRFRCSPFLPDFTSLMTNQQLWRLQ
jgi:hypothetical protein